MMTMTCQRLGDHPHVGDIRGKGMHIAIEFVKNRDTLEMYPANVNKSLEIYKACMDQGVSFCPSHGESDGIQGDCLIIKPAFTISDNELEELIDKLSAAIERVKW